MPSGTRDQALDEIPVNPEYPELTAITALKPEVAITLKLASVDSHVQGYLGKPAKEGKFPACCCTSRRA